MAKARSWSLTARLFHASKSLGLEPQVRAARRGAMRACRFTRLKFKFSHSHRLANQQRGEFRLTLTAPSGAAQPFLEFSA